MKETKEIFRFAFEADEMSVIAQTLINEANQKYGN